MAGAFAITVTIWSHGPTSRAGEPRQKGYQWSSRDQVPVPVPTNLARRTALLPASLAVGLIALSTIERAPRIVWNATASVPIGLYILEFRTPLAGETVALRLPPIPARLAARRGYLPDHALLLKPVAALAGDRVCRWHANVLINGRLRASAAHQDAAHRLLPAWQGCRTLEPDEVFLLSQSNDGFDSRYFGPIRRGALIGVAIPLIAL